MSINIGPQGLENWQSRNPEGPPGIIPTHCTQVTEARSCKKKGAARAVMPHDPNQCAPRLSTCIHATVHARSKLQ